MAGRYERGEVIITLGGSGSGRRVGPDLSRRDRRGCNLSAIVGLKTKRTGRSSDVRHGGTEITPRQPRLLLSARD